MVPVGSHLPKEGSYGIEKSIVIIDDDVDASQMEKVILEKTGLYDVTVCNRGSEGLKVVRSVRPGLVLLDIMMPDADGAEVADQIRNDKLVGATPIVFMTSLVSQGEVQESSVIGGHPFISKPVTGETLLKRVKEFF